MRSLRLLLASVAAAATVLSTVAPSYAVQRGEIVGTSGADDLLGTNGGAGDDSITDWLGIAGQPDDGAVDTFRGGTGNDILYVGHGDTVFAGAGDDRVNGYYLGDGDVVHCGLGKDVLVVNEDLHGLQTDQCEKILVKYAG